MNHTLLKVGVVTLLGIGNAQAAGDIQAGKVKAGMCAACHGANGEGVAPNPALAGMKEDQFIQAMKDYKSGKRANPVMKAFVDPLKKKEIEDLAAWFSIQKSSLHFQR